VNPEEGNSDGVQIGEIDLERTDSGIAILSISGEHDLNTAPQLRQRLEEQMDAGTGVVVDLTKASFVDSSILGVILEGARRSADSGIGFAVAQANGAQAVSRVLEVTGLRAELPVHASREDALQAATTGSTGEGS
jgi:anti-sigma B factor antagonist